MTQQQVRFFGSGAAYETFKEAERQATRQRHAREAIAARNQRRAQRRCAPSSPRATGEGVTYSRQLIAFPEAVLAQTASRAQRPVIYQGGSPGLGRRC